MVVVPVPEPRRLVNASLVAAVDAARLERGVRVVVAGPAGVHRDMRVWEPGVHLCPTGDCLVVCTEHDWYRYRLLQEYARPVGWPLAACWVEEEPAAG